MAIVGVGSPGAAETQLSIPGELGTQKAADRALL
jgi:hypothetical protein